MVYHGLSSCDGGEERICFAHGRRRQKLRNKRCCQWPVWIRTQLVFSFNIHLSKEDSHSKRSGKNGGCQTYLQLAGCVI